MPKSKRQRSAHTEDWKIIQQRTLWPEQEQYELIRPIVLFGDTPAERAEQTQADVSTIGTISHLDYKNKVPAPSALPCS
jgi:hypothetical protein